MTTNNNITRPLNHNGWAGGYVLLYSEGQKTTTTKRLIIYDFRLHPWNCYIFLLIRIPFRIESPSLKLIRCKLMNVELIKNFTKNTKRILLGYDSYQIGLLWLITVSYYHSHSCIYFNIYFITLELDLKPFSTLKLQNLLGRFPGKSRKIKKVDCRRGASTNCITCGGSESDVMAIQSRPVSPLIYEWKHCAVETTRNEW